MKIENVYCPDQEVIKQNEDELNCYAEMRTYLKRLMQKEEHSQHLIESILMVLDLAAEDVNGEYPNDAVSNAIYYHLS